eukprot:jgi/Mesvir1/17386/Mv08687-RA.2
MTMNGSLGNGHLAQPDNHSANSVLKRILSLIWEFLLVILQILESTFTAMTPRKKKKQCRVYMDGCFDMMHYGHANALRQARALGDQLIVGLVSDAEIIRNKGPPVMTYKERYAMVAAVKWVDEIIPDVPYEIDEAFMNKLFTEHGIDYIIHGDDPCFLPDGTDAYAAVRAAGRFKQIKRTEGVSSTDIVGRMLLCVRGNSVAPKAAGSAELTRQFSGNRDRKPATVISNFMTTSHRIKQFSNDRILKLAKQEGDFLLVGIHSDETVRANRGAHQPIMSLHERTLSVLACRYVDEVIIGAPWQVTRDMVTTFNISVVVRGSCAEHNPLCPSDDDPYLVPRELGIFKVLQSPVDLVTSTIIRRIVDNFHEMEKRQERKTKSEIAYLQNKTYVAEM